MTTYLLDANVLIALTVSEHEHHERATAWAAGIDRFALCPVVEGALVRFLARIGESPAVATRLLGRSTPCGAASSGRMRCPTVGLMPAAVGVDLSAVRRRFDDAHVHPERVDLGRAGSSHRVDGLGARGGPP